MKKYFLDSPKDYKLMSQTGVKQFCYPLDSTHNAIWDSNVSPEGKLYFGLASEICTSEYVHLCNYNYESNTTSECFSIKDVILPSDRTIRASKFHSSINFMPDGRLIMTTHTTDKSPAHPTWMPEAYYHHIWEGYPGSQIIIYDPKTNEAKNLGTPIPRESIYGAVYEPAHNCLYFTGIFRGHLYRYSLDDKKVHDFGQVSECYSFRLTLGPDGNIYGASKTGYVYKADTNALTVTDMNYKLPHYTQDYNRDFTNISIGRIGPDGRLYFAIMYGKSIIALDTATGTFEDMGEYLNAEHYVNGENRNGIFGMDFDSNGVLWYVVSSRNDGIEGLEYGLPASLFRWDIARKGKPEWAGLCGTNQRVGCWVSEVCISKDDILYSVGSNHGVDGPDITAVDLKTFEPTIKNLGGNTADPYYDKNDPHYIKVAQTIKDLEKISEENPFNYSGKLSASPIRLWRALAPDNISNSPVQGLYWENNNTLKGICGTENEFVFTITDGALNSIIKAEKVSADEFLTLKEAINPIKTKCDIKGLPYYPGRQYKAVPSATVKLNDGRIAVGTRDGMLAIVNGNEVFALGSAVYNGLIRNLCVTPGGEIYGAGGDIDDMGMLFTYNDKQGLRWLGHIYHDTDDNITGTATCMVITGCAVSPDGKKLAVGSGDRLGTVIIYDL